MSGPIRIGRRMIFGANVDAHTRCVHYRTDLDIVALLFSCCDRWYPCLHCHAEDTAHAEDAGHAPQRWPRSSFDTEAVLCGACGSALTIRSYLDAERCPSCAAAFNPGCALHHDEYFDLS